MSSVPKPSPTRLLAALSVPLAVLIAAYYASKGQMGDLGGAPVRLTLAAPSEVTLRPEGETPIEVTLTLENRTGDAIWLKAADACKALRWAVQAPGDEFVQAKGDACLPEETSRQLEGSGALERKLTIPLDSSRYKLGVTYTLFAQFYGYEATARFETAE